MGPSQGGLHSASWTCIALVYRLHGLITVEEVKELEVQAEADRHASGALPR